MQAAGWWLVTTYPELISLLASEEMINGVERGKALDRRACSMSCPHRCISVGILTNNIMVSLMAFVVGIFFGLGTFYIISMNGLMLGGIFAFTHQHGMAGELLKFVTAHGIVELSVICLAGAAGVMLGESLIRPTHGTRRESFQHATAKTSRLLIAVRTAADRLWFHRRLSVPRSGFSDDQSRDRGFGYWSGDDRGADRALVWRKRCGPVRRVARKRVRRFNVHASRVFRF